MKAPKYFITIWPLGLQNFLNNTLQSRPHGLSKQTTHMLTKTEVAFRWDPKQPKTHTTNAGETSGETEAYQGRHEAWSPCRVFFGGFQHTLSKFKDLHK